MSSDAPLEEPRKPVELQDCLQALFNESPVAIGFARGHIVSDANPAYARLFGYGSVAEIRGRSLLEQVAPSHRSRIVELLAARASGDEQPRRYQTRGIRQDGTEFPFDVTTTPVVVAGDALIIAFITDASEGEEALQALKASEERFRILSGAALEGVFLHVDGKIVLANEAGAAMHGLDPTSMVGMSVMDDLVAPESRALVANHAQRQTVEPYEAVAWRTDRSRFPVEIRARTLSHQGRPARFGIVRDITDRKRAEAEQRALSERVQQSQKLESLSVLAGGVAHDFNNILTVILNEVALAKRGAKAGVAPVVDLDAIALAAERAADLCRQMLAYAGRARLEREPVELSALVNEMSKMLEASIAKRALLVRDLAAPLPAILGDATQLRQIVMNLVVNASDAMSGRDGAIRVSTGTDHYDASAFEKSAAGGDLKTGTYVWLEVGDDGVGMDAPTLAQMFDPFFTTKFVGRGLGMAAVLGIVRGHGGAIDVQSRLGHGTRIRIFFPICPPTKPPPLAPKPTEELHGRGVVLLVDDEKNVRISTELLLRRFGFEVICVRDGIEAIEAFRNESGRRIDAVLLDLTMPRMGGIDTMRHLRRVAPTVPVILTSGYGSGHFDDEPLRGDRPDAILAKPYPADKLFATLQQVMRRA